MQMEANKQNTDNSLLQELINQIDSLKFQVKQLQTENTALRNEITKLSAENAALKSKIVKSHTTRSTGGMIFAL